ncbi:MAG: hypothetical protein WAX69_19015, partial [Victivallales bacterium]
EESPRADNMLSRILKYCDTPAERRRTLKIYAGDLKARSLAEKTGIKYETIQDGKSVDDSLIMCVDSFPVDGGKNNRYLVLCGEKNKSPVQNLGLAVSSENKTGLNIQNKDPLLNGIGPEVCHFRVDYPVFVFKPASEDKGIKILAEGSIAVVERESNEYVISGIGTDLSACDLKLRIDLRNTENHLTYLYSAILANMGAEPADKIVERLFVFGNPVMYRDIPFWYTSSPLESTSFKPFDENEPFPGFSGGPQAEWKILKPDYFSFVNIGDGFGRFQQFDRSTSKVWVSSPRNQTVEIYLGGDYLIWLIVNNEDILVVKKPIYAPHQGAFSAKLKLHRGMNEVILKTQSGCGAHGFYDRIKGGDDLEFYARPQKVDKAPGTNAVYEDYYRDDAAFYNGNWLPVDDMYKFAAW